MIKSESEPDTNALTSPAAMVPPGNPTAETKLWVMETLQQYAEKQQKNLLTIVGLFATAVAILTGLGLYQGFKSYIDLKLGESGLLALSKQAKAASDEVERSRVNAKKSSDEAFSLVASLNKMGFSEGLGHERMRVFSGSIPWNEVEWESPPLEPGKLTTYIHTDAAAFNEKKIPRYFTSFGGNDRIWSTGGVACIYEASSKGFRVFIHSIDSEALTTEIVKKQHYTINWIAIGE